MNHWINYWQTERYQPIITNPPAVLYGGSNIEPLASIGMSCFLDAIKAEFNDGFTVVDYGCGAGILANFISSRLKDFTYYGLEPDTDHGAERLSLGKQYLNDSRIKFGIVEDYEYIKKESIDAVILISVFTHMLFDDIVKVLDNIITIFDYNEECTIVFSCFIENVPRVVQHQPHIWERFYGESYISLTQLENYCTKNKIRLTNHIDFDAQGGYKHKIFKINKI